MNYSELTAHELVDLIKNGTVSVSELVESIFDRIEKVEDRVSGYISFRKEEALNEAKKLDDGKEKKGKLFGIPIAVKDNMNVFGTNTTCGSKILENYNSPYDATVYILDGEAKLMIGGKEVRAKTGEIVIMPANITHDVQAEQRFKMLLIMIR